MALFLPLAPLLLLELMLPPPPLPPLPSADTAPQPPLEHPCSCWSLCCPRHLCLHCRPRIRHPSHRWSTPALAGAYAAPATSASIAVRGYGTPATVGAPLLLLELMLPPPPLPPLPSADTAPQPPLEHPCSCWSLCCPRHLCLHCRPRIRHP